MFCITLESRDPYFNLAVEEVLLKNSPEEYLMMYINSPSLIIGKHQAAHREINTRFAIENSIPVIRRISGGGTVYHDMGNLNFTFIRKSKPGEQIDFRKNTAPVIDFLSSLDIEAAFDGKTEIKVDGLKISGNAEHIHRDRVLHHGTLLFSTSLDVLRKSLREDVSCYISRAVVSNRSSVTNLNARLTGFRDIYQFSTEMMHYFLRNLPETVTYELSPGECKEAELLADSKYKSWNWNWAYGPEYKFVNMFEFKNRQITCRLFVSSGIISECVIEGSSELAIAAEKLIGCPHMVEDLKKVFEEENISFPDEMVFNFF